MLVLRYVHCACDAHVYRLSRSFTHKFTTKFSLKYDKVSHNYSLGWSCTRLFFTTSVISKLDINIRSQMYLFWLFLCLVFNLIRHKSYQVRREKFHAFYYYNHFGRNYFHVFGVVYGFGLGLKLAIKPSNLVEKVYFNKSWGGFWPTLYSLFLRGCRSWDIS